MLSFNEHITDLSNSLNNYYGQTSMIYDGRFSDLDGDTLSFTFKSSDTDIATIEDQGNGIVRFTRVSSGTVTFTVTADDGNGGTVSDIFSVTIN